MVTGSQIVLVLCALLSVQLAFAAELTETGDGYVLITEGPLLLRVLKDIADNGTWDKAMFDVESSPFSYRDILTVQQVLDIRSTIDQLIQPDWSINNVPAYQIIFVYEKLKDFVRAHGRFPRSLRRFLEPYGHVFGGLESRLDIAASQRQAVSLVQDLRGTLDAIHSRGAVPDWQRTTVMKYPLISRQELVEMAIFALEAVFRVSLRLDMILAVAETHVDEADDELTSMIIAGLFKLSGVAGFLPFSNQPISTEQRRKVYGLVQKHLSAEVFAGGVEDGLALALMYGSVEDIGGFDLTRFGDAFQLWLTPFKQVPSWQVFVSQLWAREDAEQVLQLFAPTLSGQVLQLLMPQDVTKGQPLAALACNPTTECYLNFPFENEGVFTEFLYKCVNFLDSPSRTAFETKLLARFQKSPRTASGAIFRNDTGSARMAAINLAMARGRRAEAEAIFAGSPGHTVGLLAAVDAAINEREFVYEGPLVEAYVTGRPVVHGATWGRIVTSAVLRRDAKLLGMLQKKLTPADDYGLRPFLDIPCTPFYVDVYCGLFDGKAGATEAMERRRETLAGLRALLKAAEPKDGWATDVNFTGRERDIVATLASPLDGQDREAFLQQPSFRLGL